MSHAVEPATYASSNYWAERYSTAEGFHNWYYTFGDLQPLIYRALEKTGETLSTCHALEIGCGDSPLLTDFCSAKGGQSRSDSHRLHGIDIAGNVIEHLKSRQAKHTLSELKFSCMDATRLEFSEKYFDLVIDKGTVDALMCEKDETKMAQVMRRLIGETLRVMKANGAILLVSHMQPDSDQSSQFISSCFSFRSTPNVALSLLVCRKPRWKLGGGKSGRSHHKLQRATDESSVIFTRIAHECIISISVCFRV